MKLIVGLGNPGVQYERTRHNLGFRVLDEAARQWGVKFRKEVACQAEEARCERFGEEILLAKPQTFMNASGKAVRRLLAKFTLEPSDLMVVADDISLPLGRLRIRRRGGPGGHNGLASLIEELGTEDFGRIRLGIHTHRLLSKDLNSFVLGTFDAEEKEMVQKIVGDALQAMEVVFGEGITAAMNAFNGKD